MINVRRTEKLMIKKRFLMSIITAIVVLMLAASMIFTGCEVETEATEEESAEAGAAKTEEAAESLSFEGQELVLSGSTTLLQVSEAWAAAFMNEYGGTIIVNGGGSGGGIADLINGINDLANASRQIKDEEIEAAKSAGYDIQEYTVFFDGISVIVSSNVSVDGLTLEELSKIYVGEITNWKDVGGDDAGIVVIARDSSSGTGEYFLEEVVQLGKTLEDNDYTEKALRLQSNADVVNQIKNNDNAIGYIGMGYLEESLKALKVEGVEPAIETVKDGSYPISRGLYVYAPGKELTPIAEAYLDFVFSEAGQQIGIEEGFVPVK
jgi:phosphate transport system substrate-binding protein